MTLVFVETIFSLLLCVTTVLPVRRFVSVTVDLPVSPIVYVSLWLTALHVSRQYLMPHMSIWGISVPRVYDM